MLVSEKTDFICFQESEIKYLQQVFEWSIHRASALTRSKKVMTGISKSLPWALNEMVIDETGRYNILTGTYTL